MRRITFKAVLLLPVLSVLAAACQTLAPETTIKNENVTVGFRAGGQVTRTSMDANGLSASWEVGDRVSLWARNEAGSFAVNNTVFHLYGLGDGTSVFTAVMNQAMPEGTYTYYLTYPVPESVSGNSATFTIPSYQDGKVSGGADIMVGTPVQNGALKTLPEIEDHSGLYLSVNHILHQFRFYLADDSMTDGEPIRDIVVTMPRDIAGKLAADFTDPEAASILSDGVRTITMNLAEPLSASASDPAYACMSAYPALEEYGASDFMNVTVYSKDRKFETDPIALDGHAFLPGHSTPVRILPTSSREYCRITFLTGKDYIGEPLTNIAIKVGDNVVYSYDNVSGRKDDIKVVEEFLDEQGRTAYDAITGAVANGTAVLVYETEHALVTKALTASSMVRDDNIATIALGDVPYLLFEDFSGSVASAHDDAYAGGADSDRNADGYLINDGMLNPGWNAARYSVIAGDCVRVNVRYQSGAWQVERWAGRLDTPAMTCLKPGVTARLCIEFDKGFYVPAGLTYDDSNSERAYMILGTHTNSMSSPIDGGFQGDISKECTVQYTSENHKSEDVSRLAPTSVIVDGCTSDTRFVFWPCTTRDTKHIAANTCTYLYIDNIRVYIKNE